MRLPFISRRAHEAEVAALRQRIAHLEGDRPDDDRPVYRTFGVIRLESGESRDSGAVPTRVFYVFADGMIPADLVTRVQRYDDEIRVTYNAGGQEFCAEFRPLPAVE